MTHDGPTPEENPPTKMGRGVHGPDPKGTNVRLASPARALFFKLRLSTELIKTAKQVVTYKEQKSPGVCLEEHVFVFDEHLHHLSLVADVIEGCDGVHVWCTHERGSKDDGEVLRIHQVEFFILCHPAVGDKGSFSQ